MRRTKPGEGLMRRAAISDRERRSPELPEVQKAAALRGHAASEKLPQEGTACLCEGAVDKQILLLQRFGKGAAWQLICFGLLQQLPKFLCNERQAFHRPELLGCWLLYLADGREDDLPRVPAVPKIHPVPRDIGIMLPAIFPLQCLGNGKARGYAVHAGNVNGSPHVGIGIELLVYGFPHRSEKSVATGWVQLDFKDADANGNFRQKHYHENYGYDIDAVISKHPIKELDNPSHKEDLLNSLKKGNRQSATFLKDGQEVKQYVEASPQFKTLTIYDANHKRLDTRQAKEQEQSQAQGKDQKHEAKKTQSAAEDDGPGEQQEKKQRRKKQSL